jgi:hypothetical protein
MAYSDERHHLPFTARNKNYEGRSIAGSSGVDEGDIGRGPVTGNHHRTVARPTGGPT